jgi:hypothetical protein
MSEPMRVNGIWLVGAAVIPWQDQVREPGECRMAQEIPQGARDVEVDGLRWTHGRVAARGRCPGLQASAGDVRAQREHRRGHSGAARPRDHCGVSRRVNESDASFHAPSQLHVHLGHVERVDHFIAAHHRNQPDPVQEDGSTADEPH